LTAKFGRYGYRRITDLLQMAGWQVNVKRADRIWRADGLKVPKRQPKRGRLWLADGSCIRLRPEHANHVWAYDFVSETTHDGRKLRLLTVVDEYTRECLTIRVERRMSANDVLWVLADLFLEYGIPEHIRFRQWTRVRRCGSPQLARRPGGHGPVHRARLTLGERLHRVVQLQAP
jgi:putative transposase